MSRPKPLRPRQVTYTAVGENKGAHRIWLEGLRLGSTGFDPGVSYSVDYNADNRTIVIQPDTNGHRAVSSKKRNGYQRPVIDLRNRDVSEIFGRFSKARVLYYDNHIVIGVHREEIARANAWDDFLINLEGGCLSTATICVGGGISTNALKDGFSRQGIDTHTEWVIDIEPQYLQSAIDNTRAIDDETIIVCGSLTDVETELLTPVNVLNISLPCTGFSTSGRAKNQLKDPESHKSAGTTIIRALDIIEKLMPPVIINENVVPFASSATASLMAGRLKEMGYNLQDNVYGGELGTIEDRKRSIMVATHPDLDIDLELLVPVLEKQASVRDILEDIPLDDPQWRSFDYLHDKEARDTAAGKGFKQQLIQGDEVSVGVMGRGYLKARSTEPRLQHPEDPKLSRLFTAVEHARMQQVPPELVANLPRGRQHEILGQGVSYALFVALGALAGRSMAPFRNHLQTSQADKNTQGDGYEFKFG